MLIMQNVIFCTSTKVCIFLESEWKQEWGDRRKRREDREKESGGNRWWEKGRTNWNKEREKKRVWRKGRKNDIPLKVMQ